VYSGEKADIIYAAKSTTSVAIDPKKETFVKRTIAFEAGGFAVGGELKVKSLPAVLVSAVARKGVDSAILFFAGIVK